MQILFCATSYQRLAPSTFRRCVYHREIKNQFSYIIILNMIFLRPQLLPKSMSCMNSFFIFLRGRNVRIRFFFNENLAKSSLDFNQDRTSAEPDLTWARHNFKLGKYLTELAACSHDICHLIILLNSYWNLIQTAIFVMIH